LFAEVNNRLQIAGALRAGCAACILGLFLSDSFWSSTVEQAFK